MLNGNDTTSSAQNTLEIRLIIACALFLLVALVTATQYIAAYYSHDPALGETLFGTLYSPHKAIPWSAQVISNNPMMVLSAWLLALGVSAMSLIAISFFYSIATKSRTGFTGHGSAQWANREDVSKAGLVDSKTNGTSLIVGGFENSKTKKIDYLIHTGPESTLCYAPSRSGKGVSLVIPNLLSFDESAFILDVKGELWEATSGYRKGKLKQKVLFHNPSSLVAGNARFNVLDEIRVGEPTAVKDAQLIAEYLIPEGKSTENDSSGNTAHFKSAARSLLVGVVLYELNKARDFNTAVAAARESFNKNRPIGEVLALMPKAETEESDMNDDDVNDDALIQNDSWVHDYGRHEEGDVLDVQFSNPKANIDFPENKYITVCSVLSAVTNPELDFKRYLGMMKTYESKHCEYSRVIREYAMEADSREPREFTSVLSSMTNPLSIYRDPILADATSKSDFKLTDLIEYKDPISLYLIIPPSENDRLRNYFGMLVNMLCRKLTEKMPDKNIVTHRLLLMFDEFSKLPPLPIVQESLDHFAGYGIKAFIVVQDVHTLTRLYGKNETIQSNCKVRIAFTPNKLETAEMLSRMVGTKTVQEKTSSRNRKALSVVDSAISESEGLHGRALITVDEIMQLDVPVVDADEKMIEPGESLVFVTGCRPIRGIQTPYFMDADMSMRSEYKHPEQSCSIDPKFRQYKKDNLARENVTAEQVVVNEPLAEAIG